MDALASRVLRTIRRHDLLPAEARVAVAVSGGSDSVALLHLLLELQPAGGFRVAGVLHVHHGLRGAAADADQSFCRTLAASLGLPFVADRIDVRTRAARERRSLEDAARTARYEALTRGAGDLGASRIAVGHTRDDQAETVLLRLMRGAGTGGLVGIRPRNGAVVRPLLDAGRDELTAWLAGRGIPHVEDETNADVRIRRNAVRHCVLPVMREHFGSSVPVAIARHAEVAREDEAVLHAAAAEAASRALRQTPAGLVVELSPLTAAPAAVQRRVIREALLRAGVPEPALDHVLGVARVAQGEASAIELPGGVRAVLRDDGVALIAAGSPAVVGATFCYELTVPGSVWVSEAGRTVAARRADGVPEMLSRPAPPGVFTAIVDADGLSSRLTVRNWKAGDRLKPLGAGGRKKLQDLFVDRKVPAAERRRLPLVVDGEDRIVWVPGHAIDEAYRVTEGTRAVLLLTMSESGGAG